MPNDVYTAWLQLQSAQLRELQGKCEETPPVSKTKEMPDQVANGKREGLIIAGV